MKKNKTCCKGKNYFKVNLISLLGRKQLFGLQVTLTVKHFFTVVLKLYIFDINFSFRLHMCISRTKLGHK